MSQEKVEIRRNIKTQPTIGTRSTVINRTSHGGGSIMPGGGSRSVSMRMSMGGSAPSFAQGTVSSMSHKNVANVLDTRAKEKTEMNVLNERFASYIEKVRFVEAQNKALLAEIDRLKKQKNFDASEIKELYEQEIADSRKIIDDLSDEKAKFDATLVSLQDQLEDERRDRINAEKTVDDLSNKIDRLNDQLGNNEGELANLRLRIETLEDENARLKKDKRTLQDDIGRIRADLDEETCKRIQAEMKLQTAEEDCKFQINIYEAEIAELKAMLDRDRSIEMKDIWKGEISKAINELNTQYASEVDRIQAEMQKNYEMQMNEMRAGLNRDNMETMSAREESKKVKGKLNELQPLISQLQAENAMLKSRLEGLQVQYDDECREHESDVNKLQASIERLQMEMDSVLTELQVLQDAKLSLELEIAAYRKLLEAEETNMRRVVEHSSGSRSGGAQLLSDMIVSKGGSGDSQKSSMSHASKRVSLVKSARGDIRFEGCDASGGWVAIKNNGAKAINMKGWTLKKVINGMDKYSYTFTADNVAQPGKELRLVASGMKDEAKYSDIVVDNFTWAPTGKFFLVDDNNSEKATMDIKIDN
ncbi:retrograde protein of 51 kDa-like isoform X3 [Mytilus californianus]|uniref:retrograde protein of 51 kDa-like isoform X3 n=1 Tax=Mytilus californianus TaxID=6549 RepID=UPI002246CA51|nr:retrograde protein of 51 kDa-like isoform X3 [Mytilus californianus]